MVVMPYFIAQGAKFNGGGCEGGRGWGVVSGGGPGEGGGGEAMLRCLWESRGLALCCDVMLQNTLASSRHSTMIKEILCHLCEGSLTELG